MLTDNRFLAYFLDTTTPPWTPLTGLSATMTIIELGNNTVVVDNQPMKEVWQGFYEYVYNNYQPNLDYAWFANPNSASAFIISGWTELPVWARFRWGGWWESNEYLKTFEKSLTKKLTQVWEKLNEKKVDKEEKEIDFTPILDAVSSIKMPEPTKVEEKEAKKVAKQLTTVESLLKDYIKEDNDSKQDLWAIAEEFKQLILDEKKRQAEDRKREAEEKKREEEEAKKEEEEIKSEFQKQEEAENEAKRLVLEEEIKFLDEQKKEKEKELKSL